MNRLKNKEKNTNKYTISYLVICMLIVSNFFNIVFIPLNLLKILHLFFDLLVLAMFLSLLFRGRFSNVLLEKFGFLIVFLIIVLLSIISALIFRGQDLNETVRVSIRWIEYLVFFILIYKRINTYSIYNSLFIFSLIWLFCWIIGILVAPMVLFDSSGDYNSDLMNDTRGIYRLKISGEYFIYLGGLWSLSLYLKIKKRKFLYFFIISLIVVILSVSRQHILAFILVSTILLMTRINYIKKSLILLVIFIVYFFVLPQIPIYQKLNDLTKEQMQENNGGKDDVRVLGVLYYIKDFKSNTIQKIIGNGMYHSESDYGKEIYLTGLNKGFWLSDFGFVGIYIYYGIAGLICYIWFFTFVWKIKIIESFIGIKYFIYFLFLTNFISHSFDISILAISLALYLLYYGSYIYYKRKVYEKNISHITQ